jgi:hypothetical protein
MAQLTYEKEITGLVVIDPYNDFISEGVAEGTTRIPVFRAASRSRCI